MTYVSVWVGGPIVNVIDVGTVRLSKHLDQFGRVVLLVCTGESELVTRDPPGRKLHPDD